MHQCKNTLSVVPYTATETRDCPICHNESEASKQNVVIYSKGGKPFLKCAQKVRICNVCKLYFMNKILLLMLKDEMKKINKKVKRKKSCQQDYCPIIVKIAGQELHALQIAMRKSKLSPNEFDDFLETYLTESANISFTHEETQHKGSPIHVPRQSNSHIKNRSRGKKCIYPNCEKPVMKGRLFCRYHHEQENYESK